MKTEGKKCDNKIVGWETGTSFNEVETSGMLDHFRFLAKVVGTNKKSLIGFLFCSPIHLTALSRSLSRHAPDTKTRLNRKRRRNPAVKLQDEQNF